MKRFILSTVLLVSFFINGLIAEQSTIHGKQAVQDYRAKIQQGNHAPVKSYKENSQETKTSSKKSTPIEGIKVVGKGADTHSQMIKERRMEDAQDEVTSAQLKKMPQEQRNRATREYLMKRAEERNKNMRIRVENKAAADQLNKNSSERKK